MPTLYNATVNHPKVEEYDPSSIRMCASAAEALPARVWRGWKETFGSVILNGIGSTEMLLISRFQVRVLGGSPPFLLQMPGKWRNLEEYTRAFDTSLTLTDSSSQR